MPAIRHHNEEAQKLIDYYDRLSWWGRLFFPNKLSRAIQENLAPVDIINAAVNSSWFFHRWFFQVIADFFQAPVMRASLIWFNNSTTNTTNMDTLRTLTVDNDEMLAALFRINLLNGERYNCQDNLDQYNRHPNKAIVAEIITLLDSHNLLRVITAQTLFNQILRVANPQAVLDGLRLVGDQLHLNTISDRISYLDTQARVRAAQENRASNLNNNSEYEQVIDFLLRHGMLESDNDINAVRRHAEPRRLLDALTTLRSDVLFTRENCRRLYTAVNVTAVLENIRHPIRLIVSRDAEHINAIMSTLMDAHIAEGLQFQLILTRVQAHVDLRALREGIQRLAIRHQLNESSLEQLFMSRASQQPLVNNEYDIIQAQNESNMMNATPAQVSVLDAVRAYYDNPNNSKLAAALRNNRIALDNPLRLVTSQLEQRYEALRNAYPEKKGAHLKRLAGCEDDNARALEQASWFRESKPVVVEIAGADFILPMQRSDFNTISDEFDDVQRAQALRAYHGHKLHTMWRYLNGPNPWSSNGRAANIDTNNAQKKLMAILWLAVNDQDLPPTSGGVVGDSADPAVLVEARVELFINGIADSMGRGNNSKADKNNRYSGQDDYTAPDAPTCGLHPENAIFQAIQGHPMFEGSVPSATLQAAVRECLREHLRAYLLANPSCIRVTEEAIEAYAENGLLQPAQEAALRRLNLPEQTFSDLVTRLQGRYVRFDAHADTQIMRDYLVSIAKDPLRPVAQRAYYQCHVLIEVLHGKFQQLLDDVKNPRVSSSSNAFFPNDAQTGGSAANHARMAFGS